MAGEQDGFDFARRVAAVLFFDLVSDGPVGAKIVGQQTALPVVGSMTAGNEFSSRVLRLSGHDHSAQRLLDVGCHPVGDTREAIVRALPASTIGRKRLAPMIKSETPWVGHSPCIDIELFGLRSEAPDTPAIEAPGSPRGLDETVDVDRLGKVELSPGRPAQSVDKMTGIGFAEAGIHHPAALGMIIAIFVDQMDKLSGAADIGAIGNRHHRIRQQQSLGEEGRAIGATVVIRVFQDNDAVIGGAPWLVMGIGGAARDPETSPRVPIHIDRLVDHGIGGEEVDFKAVSNREGFQFLRHVRLRDFVRNIVARVNKLLPGQDLINHIAMGCGLSQPRDQFFFFFGKTFQVIHLAGQVAHFMPAKQVGIGSVQRPQASRIETVFLDDQLAQPFILRVRPPIDDGDPFRVFAIVPGEGDFAVDF